MFEVSVLASGSSGNSFFVGSEESTLLIDAGISAKQIADRLKSLGKDVKNLDGIFITHEHSDHIRGVDVLSRKYKIPIFMNQGTFDHSYLDITPTIIPTDKKFSFDGLSIFPFLKNHDAAEPVSYRISNGNESISVMTDIGFGCNKVKEHLSQSDLVILESNHDDSMLKTGPYPYPLKQRIASDKGHLSNYDAGLLVLEHAKSSLQHVFLSHLSLTNNRPDIALGTFQTLISERSDLSALQTHLTFREKPTSLVQVKNN